MRFTGAAGRLTSEDRIRRSWLPDSLDPADVTAAELSPASNRNVADYEAQLERWTQNPGTDSSPPGMASTDSTIGALFSREFALVVGLGTGVSEDATPDAWEDVTRTSAFGLVPNIGRAAGLIAHAPSRSFAFDHVALHFHPDTFKSLHNEMKRQYFVASRFLFRAGGVWNKPDVSTMLL